MTGNVTNEDPKASQLAIVSRRTAEYFELRLLFIARLPWASPLVALVITLGHVGLETPEGLVATDPIPCASMVAHMVCGHVRVSYYGEND